MLISWPLCQTFAGPRRQRLSENFILIVVFIKTNSVCRRKRSWPTRKINLVTDVFPTVPSGLAEPDSPAPTLRRDLTSGLILYSTNGANMSAK